MTHFSDPLRTFDAKSTGLQHRNVTITFRRRVSGYLKSAAWLFVIFVSDSLWSSFLFTILVWKIVLQFVRSNRQIFILRCISNHPYHKRRLRMLKLQKTNKQTKKKPKQRQTNKEKKKHVCKATEWIICSPLFHCF